MKSLIVIMAVVFGAYFLFFNEAVVKYSAAEKLTEIPLLEPSQEKSFSFKGYKITSLADFTVKARVLSYKRYSSGKEAELSPIDLALGWGPMAADKNVDEISVSQRGRWYFWKCSKFPIPRNIIETHSCNMHIIPANNKVLKKLDDIQRGHVVNLKGYLIEARQDDGWKWRSSMSRSDKGNHACEVFYVTKAVIVRPK
jgi:hypothetical protein